jgi:GNAT superfamily N-acetyltransferase
MPSPAVTCILGTPADLNALSVLMQSFYTTGGLAYTPAVAAATAELLANPALGFVILIAEDGAVIGYLVILYGFSLERGGKTALLDEFFVIPARRGAGRGKAALQEAIRLSRLAGCQEMFLEVDHDNPRAKQLYESAGFVAMNRNVMTKPLHAGNA